MASSNEMYELGAQDAMQDDLNLFYYQHYYYYRKGYNDTRRRLRRPVGGKSPLTPGLLVVLLILALAGGFLIWRNQPVESVSPAPAPPVVDDQPAIIATPRRRSTTTPAAPTPTSTVTAPTLASGGFAVVTNVGASSLRARTEPGTDQPVQARFAEGTRVRIIEGPVENDGFTWWLVTDENAQGWSAERSVDGMVWLTPDPQ